jgi:transketolase
MKNDYLKEKARKVRIEAIDMIYTAGSGHPGGSLGVADLLTYLYYNVLKTNASKPSWNGRDRFILSNGHVCPALYAVLAEKGFFKKDRLKTLRKMNGLQGHPERGSLPGIETSAGPLGLGLGISCGMALKAKMDGEKHHIYCMMSDGEQDEGATWEAAMFAAKNKLDNLTAIIDRNKIQLSGPTEKIMPLENLKEKYEAFNWNVIEIKGHDFNEMKKIKTRKKGKPTLIIANTIPGKGVSFMEGKFEWHGKAPNKSERDQAIKELNKQ